MDKTHLCLQNKQMALVNKDIINRKIYFKNAKNVWIIVKNVIILLNVHVK